MEFEIGEKAVYPAHGVGIITKIEEVSFDDFRQTFYVLEIAESSMVIRVPVDNVETIGMRRVIGSEHVEKVYEILKDRDVPPDTQTWNRRYREYMNRIKTGDPLEVAKVLRDLAMLRKDKALSFGERKMYDQANSLLTQEISVARGLPEEQVQKELDEIFSS
jgi:CarD family transcriptional regulator